MTAFELTPDDLLRAYANGLFPMAEARDDPALYLFDPEVRGIIPLDGFHVPRPLARRVRSGVRSTRRQAAPGAGCEQVTPRGRCGRRPLPTTRPGGGA